MRIAFLGNFGVDYSSESHHAKSLELLGHEVTRLQEGRATGDQVLYEAERSQMLVVVHTHGWQTPGQPMGYVFDRLKAGGIPTVTYHLDLWLGLKRQRDLDSDPFYRSIGHFFTVDPAMAQWFNANTEVKGHYLPAAVYGPECYISTESSLHANDVVFVGSRGYHPEWPYRPQLIDWLRETYGDRFTHVGGDGDTGTIRGHALNALYANSKVAVGDTLCPDFTYPGYWSDRVYETLGRGGVIIHPRIAGLDNHLAYGVDIATYQYGNFGELRRKIDFFLANDELRERMRINGHQRVKSNHTYAHRWQAVLDMVFA